MGKDGMEAIDLRREPAGQLDNAERRPCLAPGCACRDLRILSPRRSRFHAYLARKRGETADRVIAPDLEWHLPESVHGELR